MAQVPTNGNIINVFMTYKHDTGGKYIEQLKKLLVKCSKYCEEPVQLNFITDKEKVSVGEDYSKLDEYYNQSDVEVVVMTEKICESIWPTVDILALKSRGVPVLAILCSGSMDDAKPAGVDSGWFELKKFSKDDMKKIAAKLVKCEQKADHLTYDQAVEAAKIEKIKADDVKNNRIDTYANGAATGNNANKNTVGKNIRSLFSDALGKILAILIVLAIFVGLYIIAAKVFNLTGLDDLLKKLMDLLL